MDNSNQPLANGTSQSSGTTPEQLVTRREGAYSPNVTDQALPKGGALGAEKSPFKGAK